MLVLFSPRNKNIVDARWRARVGTINETKKISTFKTRKRWDFPVEIIVVGNFNGEKIISI